MRSPVAAMLWENWQLTRVEAAQRMALGIVAASAVLVLFDAGATIAFWILLVLHGMFVWLSILKLNGGRFMDGYKPGFPFYLLYTRPVPTVVLVGVAMIYDAFTCAAMYLVSAAVVGFAFGQSFPLFSVALYIVVFHLCYACVQWSTQNRVVQWVGSIAFSWPLSFMLKFRVTPSLQVEFSLVENALLVLIGVLSIVLTVVGVARQRRGDAVASVPRTAGSGGYPDWLVNLFRFPCPASSATSAQVWFEFKSSGLPVLAIGLVVAMTIFLLFAISVSVKPVRYVAVPVLLFSIPVVLFSLGNNAFGIRRKQGRTYASTFEATQPYGTAQMVGLKLLVRTGCVLVSLSVVGLSVWAASSFLGAWGEWPADGKKNALPGLLKLRQDVADTLASQTGYAHAAQAVVASIAIAALVAWQAAREAIRVRYPRQLLVVQGVPIAWSFAMILLILVSGKGIEPAPLVRPMLLATTWISGAAMLLATTYFLWNGIAQRALTIRYACGALLLSAAFGAAWHAGIRQGNVNGILWLSLGILTAIILSPWALSRVRHQ